jgi:hypothetical protein
MVLKTASAKKLPAGACTIVPQQPFSEASIAARAAAAASPLLPSAAAAADASPSVFCFFFSLRSCRLLKDPPCAQERTAVGKQLSDFADFLLLYQRAQLPLAQAAALQLVCKGKKRVCQS